MMKLSNYILVFFFFSLSGCTNLFYDTYQEYSGDDYAVLKTYSFTTPELDMYQETKSGCFSKVGKTVVLHKDLIFNNKEKKIDGLSFDKERNGSSIEGREYKIKTNMLYRIRYNYRNYWFWAEPSHYYDLTSISVLYQYQVHDRTADKPAIGWNFNQLGKVCK